MRTDHLRGRVESSALGTDDLLAQHCNFLICLLLRLARRVCLAPKLLTPEHRDIRTLLHCMQASGMKGSTLRCEWGSNSVESQSIRCLNEASGEILPTAFAEILPHN